MSEKPEKQPTDAGMKTGPKRVDDLPTLDFTRARPRTRRQAARKDVLFGVTSLRDVFHAVQELIVGNRTVKK
jgi:hypothetical protein